jgi:hypothetical protein
MNSQLLDQIATQHVTEVRHDASQSHRSPVAAREARESIRTRAGWTLINAGLKLTGPPAQGRKAAPHPVGL